MIEKKTKVTAIFFFFLGKVIASGEAMNRNEIVDNVDFYSGSLFGFFEVLKIKK